MEGLSTKVEFSKGGKLLVIHRRGRTPLTCQVPAGLVTPTPEKIEFQNTDTVIIDYTTARRNSFGDHPELRVWINEAGVIKRTFIFDIEVSPEPPLQTNYTIRLNGPSTGFITLST